MMSSQFASRVALQRDKVDSFERYPFNLPAVRALDRIELHPKITFFVGENGSGKSTLLEAIAVSMGFNAEGGSRNFNFGTRSAQLHATLRCSDGSTTLPASGCTRGSGRSDRCVSAWGQDAADN
jgi:predicted ATPase